MKVKKRIHVCLLALSIALASLPVTGTTSPQDPPAPVAVQSGTEAHEPFKFGNVDLELLGQINLLDQRFEKEGVVYHEAALDIYLDDVGKAIVAGKEFENVAWKFRVLRDPTPNAFALPNGSIYIHTGLLALLETEAQLASIMAHEVSHVTNRHTYKQNRSVRKKVLAINILSTVATWNPVAGGAGTTINLIASITPLMLAISIFGYSREQEKDADLDGLKNLTAAGYPPDQMVDSLKLLQKDIEGEQISSFYSDHPKLQDRVNYVSKTIPSPANKLSEEQLREAKKTYLARMENVDRHNVELAINAARFRSAYYVSSKLLEFNPDSTDNTFYLADSYRALGPRAPELTPAELTGGAKKKAAKNRNKRTLEELEAEMLLTPPGQQAWKSNQEKAEQLYLRSLELNRFNARSHRGLGMLYEKIGRKQEAASEYSKYLELSPNALDTERIRRRVMALRGTL